MACLSKVEVPTALSRPYCIIIFCLSIGSQSSLWQLRFLAISHSCIHCCLGIW
uniref:Uncharacterized protein n=1 Tax=Arundo donax TaxID=35708 RepID=A0A0A9I3B5_ARUDO